MARLYASAFTLLMVISLLHVQVYSINIRTYGRNDYQYVGKLSYLNYDYEGPIEDDQFLQTASSLEKKSTTSSEWFLVDDLIVFLYCKLFPCENQHKPFEWAQQKKHNKTQNVTNKTKVDIYNDNSDKSNNCKVEEKNNTQEEVPEVSGSIPPKQEETTGGSKRLDGVDGGTPKNATEPNGPGKSDPATLAREAQEMAKRRQIQQRQDVSAHSKTMDGVHGSDVAKAAENSERNREKIDMAKNGPSQKPTNEDSEDIKDIPGVGRDQANGLKQKSPPNKKK